MKKARLLVAAGALAFVLTACSGIGNYDKTTLVIEKDNGISEYIVEDFEKSYYNAEELKQSIVQAVDAYHKEDGTTDLIELKKFQADEEAKKVRVRMEYKTAQDYQRLHRVDFFVGTVSEAKKAGYNLENLQVSKPEGESKPQDVSSLSGEKIVLCSEEIQVSVPGEVLYVSENVTVQSEGPVQMVPSDEGRYSVVVYQ